jgi:iron complex outermembrane receptor protein
MVSNVRRIPSAFASVFFLVCAASPARATQAPAPSPAPAATPGVVSGHILTAEGRPVPDARVQLLELRRQVQAGADGSFRFENVPAGLYLLQAESAREGLNVARVEVKAGEEARIEMTVDLARHQEEVVVTAGEAATLTELARAVTVLSGTELALRRESSLGETLAQQPGISSTYFGPGASRPVIRGFGGDRIRVLQTGIGTADASNTSPDHAVSTDPLSARQIEVLRGPATLLYGSNAVGGVVNVIDNRIPDRTPDRPVVGAAELSGATVADERAGALSLDGRLGRLAWHADVFKRKTDDVSIPGFAESAAVRAEEEAEEEEHEQDFGVLGNSATDTEGASLGGSWVREGGFLGLSLSGLNSLYGVPGGHHHEEEEAGHEAGEEEEAEVRIDLQQRRADLRGELTRGFGPFRSARLRLGLADYEHTELEGEAVGTVFTNDSWEGRLELPHRRLGPLSGTLGVQASRRDFEAVGEEAFLPPTVTRSWSAFAFEELGRGAWKLQLGGRLERQDVETDAGEVRSFTGTSGSAGVVWTSDPGWAVGASLSRSVKLPTAEELFSNGPHIATRAFEVGDPDLRQENSLGLDLTLRRRAGRVTGEVNLFANWFDGYIYEAFTDEEEDGLAVFRYVQSDARFIGAEAGVTFDLYHAEPHHLDLELTGDVVRADLTADDQPLPRIPPARVGAVLHYSGERLEGRVEARRVAEQDRIAPFERPTGGYTMVNASLGYRFFLAGRTILDVLLRGTNLTDEEARNHVSFLKDVAPLPGRDVRLSVRLTF